MWLIISLLLDMCKLILIFVLIHNGAENIICTCIFFFRFFFGLNSNKGEFLKHKNLMYFHNSQSILLNYFPKVYSDFCVISKWEDITFTLVLYTFSDILSTANYYMKNDTHISLICIYVLVDWLFLKCHFPNYIFCILWIILP